MKLKNAFSTLICFSFLLLTILAASIIHFTEKLEVNSDKLLDTMENVRAAESLGRKLLRYNRESLLYTLTRDPKHLSKMHSALQSFDQMQKSIDVYSEAQTLLLKDMNASVSKYFSLRSDLLKGDLSALEQFQLTSDELDIALEKIDVLTKYYLAESQELKYRSQLENSVAKFIAIIVLVCAIFGVIFVLIGIYVKLYRPLEKIQKSLLEYGLGDSNIRIDNFGLKEIKTIAMNFNQMADIINKRKAEQLQSLASIAHDIRNPLNSILLSSQILTSEKSNETPEETKRELLDIISRQVAYLNRMVGDLIDSTRIEAGKLELIPERCELNTILSDLVKLGQFSMPNHKIIIEIPPDPVECIIDPARICQVINNLLSNAIKYSPQGGVINVSLKKDAENIYISIADSGIGIPESEIESIFEPFRRAKFTKESFAGVGLGLSASRKIVEAHGGQITVTSKVGVGSTFIVRLPKSLTNISLNYLEANFE